MIPQEAFDEVGGGKKNLRVFLVVQPSGSDPWRTQGDYIQDRESANLAEKRAIEAHQSAIRVAKWTVVAAWVSVFALIATLVSTAIQVRAVLFEVRELDRNIQSAQKNKSPDDAAKEVKAIKR